MRKDQSNIQLNNYFFEDLISVPALMIAFLFRTVPPLLKPTRSSEDCFIPICSEDRTEYIAGIDPK